MTRSRILALVVILILLVLAPTIKRDILGGSPYVSLPAAPALAGIVSQSLGGTGNNAPLPVEGKDYSLSVQYFNNRAWAVGTIKPLNNSLNPSTIVLEKQQGAYQVIIWPASAAPSTQLQNLPTNVADYTRARMAIYQPVPDDN